MEGKTRRDAMTAGLAAGLGGLGMAAIMAPEARATTSGRCIISGEESRSSSSFGLLSTSDQVLSIDVPTQGKLRISYLAAWKGDTDKATITAAIFIGSDQLLNGTVTTSSAQAKAVLNSSTVEGEPNKYASLRTSGDGLSSGSTLGGPTTFSGYPTTGVIISPCEVFVAAGTYSISVQFKASAGAVLVKDRRLWVEAIAY
jgi:hypothetical protein